MSDTLEMVREAVCVPDSVGVRERRRDSVEVQEADALALGVDRLRDPESEGVSIALRVTEDPEIERCVGVTDAVGLNDSVGVAVALDAERE